MSAEFETGAFIGQRAWHGQGNVLRADDPSRFIVPDFVRKAGLDWSVALEDMIVRVGEGENSVELPVPDRKAVIRSSDQKVLGTVGNRYVPLQNINAFEWFQPFLDTKEVAFETGGSLKGGTVIWALAKILGDDLEVSQGDKILKYLLLTTSHDGSAKTHVGFCPIRVVCINTLRMAMRSEAGKLFGVKHTKNQDTALDVVRDTINLCNRSFEATVEEYRKMQLCKLDDNELRKYVTVVMNGDKEKVSTRMDNIISSIVGFAKSGKGQQGDLNMWSAYNGVTEYLSHEVGRNADTRQQSLWYGENSKVNQKALDLAIEIAS